MIVSYRDKRTADFAAGKRVKAFSGVERAARLKLDRVEAALRLAHFFGTSPEFWLNLQNLYELRLAEAKSGKAIKRLPRLKQATEVHI